MPSNKRECEISPAQISHWKKQLLKDNSQEVFKCKGQPLDSDAFTVPLYQEIGRLKMELDWLKKIRL